MTILAQNASKNLKAYRTLLASSNNVLKLNESGPCPPGLKALKFGQRLFAQTARTQLALPTTFLRLRASPTCHFPHSSIRLTAALHTSSTRRTQHTALKDDSHPSLYYHLFDSTDGLAQPIFALSFLEERPVNAQSATVLGWLPAGTPSAEGPGEQQGESGLNDFVENKFFVDILHDTVKGGLLEDEIWVNGAIQAQSGWMHIFDQRSPPPLGRIPSPDDILATVRVENSQMDIDTYAPMPSYRLCTGDGVCQLTDRLMDRLREVLRRTAAGEGKNH